MLKKIYFQYGAISDAQAQFIVQHFDMVCVDYLYNGGTHMKLKQLKPALPIINYQSHSIHEHYPDWATCDAHEDWFIHDTIVDDRPTREHRLRVKGGGGWAAGAYLMNTGNPEYRTHMATKFKWVLDNHPEFAGVFLDSCWNAFTSGIKTIFTVDPQYVPDLPDWHAWETALSAEIKATIGSKIFALNIQSSGCIDYLNAGGDIGIAECFVRCSELGSYVPVWWKSTVNAFRVLATAGKLMVAMPGVITVDGPDELKTQKEMAKTGLCLMLLSAEDTSKLGFSLYAAITAAVPEMCYIPEMDFDFGSPVESTVQLVTDVWKRAFSKCIICVNMSTTAYTFNGNIIQPKTALIIPTAPVKHTLAYQSTPIAVPLTVDGQQLLSGQSTQIEEGKTVTIKVPAEVEI